jgi:putative nucleotidyltransferase with HDIG domain
MEEYKAENGGGWFLALVTAAAAVVLFLPLPLPITGEATPAEPEWLAPESLAAALGFGLMAAAFWLFRLRLWPKDGRESRSLRNCILLIVPQAILLRAAVEIGPATEALSWSGWPREAWLWTPWFLTTGLAVVLLGGRFGALISLSGVAMLYLRADPGPLPLGGSLASCIAALLMLRRAPTRSRVMRAGGGAGLILGVIAAVNAGFAREPFDAVSAAALVPVGMGLMSAFLVLAILPVMEWLLGEQSDVTLVEFGSDHRLLDELKEQAPGTWHHTLNVADLSEKAAAAIGARALFCRTASFFHDIGKLKDPAIFAENIDGPSPHDSLEPRESARRIIEHVTYGLELARKHRLPNPFRDIIAEHHGVSVVRYFYAQACAQLQEGEDPESLRREFSYPGPPPSTRESGIIALADGLEAATRSLEPGTEGELRAFVRQFIAERVAEGELKLCPLTLAELARIQESFTGWLKARGHRRPAYPKSDTTLAEGASDPVKTSEGGMAMDARSALTETDPDRL